MQNVLKAYLVDPASASQLYLGTENCFDGTITSVQLGPERAALGASISMEVGVLLSYDKASKPEQYRSLSKWAEHRKEGDIIRVSCTFAEFAPVEGAPESTVIPILSDCALGEF